MRTQLIRREPFRDLQEEMERALRAGLGSTEPATAGAFSPALDVAETEEGFTLYVELPGISHDDVGVELEDSVLTISGERRSYDETQEANLRRVERRFGRFHRSVRLPDRVDSSGVQATFKDGILQISVPKAEEAKPRRIEVRAG